MDVANNFGTPILASGSGVVERAVGGCGTVGYLGNYCNSGYGNYIMIKHNNGSEVVYSLYAHLTAGSFQVSVGQSVSQGQVIGFMGSSGFSSGPHLHFMLMPGRNYNGLGCRLGASKCFNPSRFF